MENEEKGVALLAQRVTLACCLFLAHSAVRKAPGVCLACVVKQRSLKGAIEQPCEVELCLGVSRISQI
jgi:hypothetical protein